MNESKGLPRWTVAAAGVAAALLLAGCGGRPMHGGYDGMEHGGHMGGGDRPDRLTAPELAKRFVAPGRAAGAIVINKQGEIIVVDEFGKVVEPCRLCGEGSTDPACRETAGDAAQRKSPREPICNGIVGTTLRSVQPISIVRHKGSECMLVSAQGHSDFYTYQICW
jgi:hypothetical protein